jgi:hypothetical protein
MLAQCTQIKGKKEKTGPVETQTSRTVESVFEV